jgi:hypothetical protein
MFGNEQTTYNQWLVIITPFTVATAECGPPTVCPAKIILSGGIDTGCCMKRQICCAPRLRVDQLGLGPAHLARF